jgi:hypothetical protein
MIKRTLVTAIVAAAGFALSACALTATTSGEAVVASPGSSAPPGAPISPISTASTSSPISPASTGPIPGPFVTDGSTPAYATTPTAGTLAQFPCVGQLPVGAPPAAAEYLTTVATLMPWWEAVSNSLAAEGGIDHAYDLANEADVDSSFVARLELIRFPPIAQSAASAYIHTVNSYISLMRTSYDQYGYLASHISQDSQLHEQQDEFAVRLRTDLGLPANTCLMGRP